MFVRDSTFTLSVEWHYSVAYHTFHHGTDDDDDKILYLSTIVTFSKTKMNERQPPCIQSVPKLNHLCQKWDMSPPGEWVQQANRSDNTYKIFLSIYLQGWCYWPCARTVNKCSKCAADRAHAHGQQVREMCCRPCWPCAGTVNKCVKCAADRAHAPL